MAASSTSSSEALFNPSQYVRKVFKDTEDPLDAIETIQWNNKIKVPSVHAALSLLDLHGVSREEIHRSLFTSLEDKLRGRLSSLEPKSIKRLLDKSFQFTAIPEICRVVMRMLESLSQPIDEKYLLEIAEKEDLYSDCPIGVKRQIWQLNPGVFGEAVSPLLDQYIAEKEALLFNISEQTKESFFMQSVKQRRQSAILKQLVDMLGTSIPLYNTLTQFLRTLFLRTHVGHYCTLRADITMTLHEQDNVIMDSDRCHKFAWCLDACIRASAIDEKKLRELYAFLDTIQGGDDILEKAILLTTMAMLTLRDVSMLLRDPFILHTISCSIITTLQKLLNDNKLPRDSNRLENLLRILFIGLKSASYLETKSYSGDPLEVEILIKFLPELMSFMAESAIKVIHIKLKQDHPIHNLSSNFIRFLTTVPAAMQITCTYTLHLIEKKDFRSLSLLLPSIALAYIGSETDIFPDSFMHSIVIELANHFSTIREAFLIPVLKEFFLPCARHSETCLLYLCRFVWICSKEMKPDFVQEILDEMQPASDQVSPLAQDQYQELLDHVRNITDS